MRGALWFLALFGMAVVGASFVGNNQGMVSIFWPPHRIDFSVNLALLVLVLCLVLLLLVQQALSSLLTMPQRAQRWRAQQKERSMYAALLNAWTHLNAGRFVRGRKAALFALSQSEGVSLKLGAAQQVLHVRALSHVIAADCAHALQDKAERERHAADALRDCQSEPGAMLSELCEGILLRQARWAVDDRDAQDALVKLENLPQGVGRRIFALRTRLKAARLSQNHALALETARALAKHKAFSAPAAQSIVRGLASELLRAARDSTQLIAAWERLDSQERKIPEITLQAAQQWCDFGGSSERAGEWIRPLWDSFAQQPQQFNAEVHNALIQTLCTIFQNLPEDARSEWLERIESVYERQPHRPQLQYLMGMVCLQGELWGKAQQLLEQCVHRLEDRALQRSAWAALAVLAEQRQDVHAAARAWKLSAQ